MHNRTITLHRLARPARRGALLAAGALFLAAPGAALAFRAPLPQTGQNACYDVSGNQLNSCAGTGQDGETLAGTSWPATRFTVNPDATVTDNLTGLAWTRDANAPGPAACAPGVAKSWPEALSYVNCLNTANYLGHRDWRLPNIKELTSLVNAGQGTVATWLSNNHFDNVQFGRYKSSTAGPANSSGTPLVMNLSDGSVQGYFYGAADHVWPVRTSQVQATLQLPATGASQCFDPASGTAVSCTSTGQDGELREGTPWSGSSRFTAGTGVLDDGLTGLEWATAGSDLVFGECSGGSLEWGAALQFVRCLNDNQYLGKTDWRLPNASELASLTNAGTDSFSWLTGLGFDLAPDHSYWSSTTYLQQPDSAWAVPFGMGGFPAKLDKTLFGNALAVRTLPSGTGNKPGDVNNDGVVDIQDAVRMYQLYVTPPVSFEPLADVAPLGGDGKPGGNGVLDAGDLIILLRYLVLKNNPGTVQW